MDRHIPEDLGDEGSDLSDDELEANTVKYNIARIVRLSSGRFALFSPFDNDEGIRLTFVGSLADLEQYIPTADECQANVDGVSDMDYLSRAGDGEPNQLLLSLGLLKPTEPLKRRI